MAGRPVRLLRWASPDPAALAERLRRSGIEARDDAFRLGPLVVRLVAGSVDRWVADDGTGLGVPDPPVSPGWAVVALAWATVDAGRAAAELGADGVDRRPRDPVLGASVVLVPSLPVPTALLEPDIEGRLTAMLARHGEGPVGLYAVRAGPSVAAFPERGPFGPQRLLVFSSAPWAPVILHVEPMRSARASAATIEG